MSHTHTPLWKPSEPPQARESLNQKVQVTHTGYCPKSQHHRHSLPPATPTCHQESAFTLIYPTLPSNFSLTNFSGHSLSSTPCSSTWGPCTIMEHPSQFPYPWPLASETAGSPPHSLTYAPPLPHTSAPLAFLPVQPVGRSVPHTWNPPTSNPFTQVHTL